MFSSSNQEKADVQKQTHLHQPVATVTSPPPGRLPRQSQIGFIGLGHMGPRWRQTSPPAGYRVTAYVLRPDRIDELAALGLKPTMEIADLSTARSSSAWCRTINAVRDVVLGGKPPASKVSFGLEARRHSPFHEHDQFIHGVLSRAGAMPRHGQRYVSAPVLGNPDAAKARQLYIIAAGAAADIERCAPLFDRSSDNRHSLSAPIRARKPY